MPFSFKSSNQYFKLEIQVNEIHVEIFFVLQKVRRCMPRKVVQIGKDVGST